MTSTVCYRLLRIALVVFGALMMLLYPLAVVWPSGWAWHHGAPYESHYFMMIVGLYVVLGVFLCLAARRPEDNVSLIWFTVCSSVVHAAIMAVQSFGTATHWGTCGVTCRRCCCGRVSVLAALLVRGSRAWTPRPRRAATPWRRARRRLRPGCRPASLRRPPRRPRRPCPLRTPPATPRVSA